MLVTQSSTASSLVKSYAKKVLNHEIDPSKNVLISREIGAIVAKLYAEEQAKAVNAKAEPIKSLKLREAVKLTVSAKTITTLMKKTEESSNPDEQELHKLLSSIHYHNTVDAALATNMLAIVHHHHYHIGQMHQIQQNLQAVMAQNPALLPTPDYTADQFLADGEGYLADNNIITLDNPTESLNVLQGLPAPSAPQAAPVFHPTLQNVEQANQRIRQRIDSRSEFQVSRVDTLTSRIHEQLSRAPQPRPASSTRSGVFEGFVRSLRAAHENTYNSVIMLLASHTDHVLQSRECANSFGALSTMSQMLSASKERSMSKFRSLAPAYVEQGIISESQVAVITGTPIDSTNLSANYLLNMGTAPQPKFNGNNASLDPEQLASLVRSM